MPCTFHSCTMSAAPQRPVNCQVAEHTTAVCVATRLLQACSASAGAVRRSALEQINISRNFIRALRDVGDVLCGLAGDARARSHANSASAWPARCRVLQARSVSPVHVFHSLLDGTSAMTCAVHDPRM